MTPEEFRRSLRNNTVLPAADEDDEQEDECCAVAIKVNTKPKKDDDDDEEFDEDDIEANYSNCVSILEDATSMLNALCTDAAVIMPTKTRDQALELALEASAFLWLIQENIKKGV